MERLQGQTLDRGSHQKALIVFCQTGWFLLVSFKFAGFFLPLWFAFTSFLLEFFHFGDDIFHFYKFSCFLCIVHSLEFSCLFIHFVLLFWTLLGCFLFLSYGVHIGQLPSNLPGSIPTSMPSLVMVFAIGFRIFAASGAGGVYNLMHIYLWGYYIPKISEATR